MKAKYKLGQLVKTFSTNEHGEIFGEVNGVVLKSDTVEYLVGSDNYPVKETNVAAAYRAITPRKSAAKTSAKKASKKETVAKTA